MTLLNTYLVLAILLTFVSGFVAGAMWKAGMLRPRITGESQ